MRSPTTMTDATAQLSLAQKAHELTQKKRAESPEDPLLQMAEIQLKYISKILGGKRPNRSRLARIELSAVAARFSHHGEADYAQLLIESQHIANSLFARTVAIAPLRRQKRTRSHTI